MEGGGRWWALWRGAATEQKGLLPGQDPVMESMRPAGQATAISEWPGKGQASLTSIYQLEKIHREVKEV
jgi:hypothetical protein